MATRTRSKPVAAVARLLTPDAAWSAYWDEGLSFRECGEVFGVPHWVLAQLFVTWGFPARPRGPRRPPRHPATKLSDAQIQYILDTTRVLSRKVLSEKLGVSRQRISQIRQGRHRAIGVRHVEYQGRDSLESAKLTTGEFNEP